METDKKISLRLLIWIFVWFVIPGACLTLFVYWETGALKGTLHSLDALSEAGLASLDAALKDSGRRFFLALGVGLLVAAFFLWVSLRAALKKLVMPMAPPKEVSGKKAPGPVAGAEDGSENENLRREFHLMSLLQREGRLVDFLQEDLQAYEDAQIGAAVRSIQENCQKTLNRYVDPRAIIDQEEGEEVLVPEGFDPSVIKLSGKVSGRPPFKGILQHRGWRAGRRNLPALSGTLDPDVISPAEVEIPE